MDFYALYESGKSQMSCDTMTVTTNKNKIHVFSDLFKSLFEHIIKFLEFKKFVNMLCRHSNIILN